MKILELARCIDHSALKPETGEAEIRKLTAQALEHHFAAVCVNACWIDLVSDLIHHAGADNPDNPDQYVAPCACVGFPFGTSPKSVKAAEAATCVKLGAHEIDMVIFIPSLLAGDINRARDDVMEVVKAVRLVRPGTIVKVILETALLNPEQIALGCRAAQEAGADFVKTSTGFHPAGGATEAAVRQLRAHAGEMKVKASGGIRNLATARAMLAAGANRLGCSASVAILEELEKGSTEKAHSTGY
ncbi:MAG TPA: deoxyribose-phosphate aldolase [Phycisphaerae bacterium]|nr:deoxyribose-phosphate aldolase [Phycisphaerae bacterium]